MHGKCEGPTPIQLQNDGTKRQLSAWIIVCKERESLWPELQEERKGKGKPILFLSLHDCTRKKYEGTHFLIQSIIWCAQVEICKEMQTRPLGIWIEIDSIFLWKKMSKDNNGGSLKLFLFGLSCILQSRSRKKGGNGCDFASLRKQLMAQPNFLFGRGSLSEQEATKQHKKTSANSTKSAVTLLSLWLHPAPPFMAREHWAHLILLLRYVNVQRKFPGGFWVYHRPKSVSLLNITSNHPAYAPPSQMARRLFCNLFAFLNLLKVSRQSLWIIVMQGLIEIHVRSCTCVHWTLNYQETNNLRSWSKRKVSQCTQHVGIGIVDPADMKERKKASQIWETEMDIPALSHGVEYAYIIQIQNRCLWVPRVSKFIAFLRKF